LSIPVTEGACAGKMQRFIRIYLRILPVATSVHRISAFTQGKQSKAKQNMGAGIMP